MGSSLVMLGTLALWFSYSKRHGWDWDCLIGGSVAIAAGALITVLG